jgi:hypothetical protein
MPKPRYDEEKDETRHAVSQEERCETMQKKYGWTLKMIEPTGDTVLPVDCVFDGYCPFPPGSMDLAQGDVLKEKEEDE